MELGTRALSGYAEWFWLMAKNIKPVENRKWSLTRYIKRSQLPIRIYLHASKTPARNADIAFIVRQLNMEELIEFNAVDFNSLRGCLIGEITVVDEVTAEDVGMDVTHSPWFFGPYGFMVEDGLLYDKPIPYKGKLGFFEVKEV
jgi:hypothetical protein